MFNFKIDDAAKYVALISAGLYAAGFLIVNANLASYGDFDPDFASARYIFAGFLFVWFLVPVSWIVLKYMHELSPQGADFQTLKTRNIWLYFVIFLQSTIIELVARLCAAASLFSLSAINNDPTNSAKSAFVAVLFGAGLLIERYFFRKFIWLNQATLILIQIFLVVLFLRVSSTVTIAVALVYFLITLYFSFIYDPITSPNKDFHSKAQIVYFAISSITAITVFGTTIYGNVKHQYGGGLPVGVTVYMKSDVGTSELTKTASGGFLIDMIALNDKKLIGISGGKLAIINADSIASVIYP